LDLLLHLNLLQHTSNSPSKSTININESTNLWIRSPTPREVDVPGEFAIQGLRDIPGQGWVKHLGSPYQLHHGRVHELSAF
jgi:hypothetical protein